MAKSTPRPSKSVNSVSGTKMAHFNAGSVQMSVWQNVSPKTGNAYQSIQISRKAGDDWVSIMVFPSEVADVMEGLEALAAVMVKQPVKNKLQVFTKAEVAEDVLV